MNPQQNSGTVGYVLISIFVVGVVLVAYDVLFSAPEHQSGVIIEKIFIPAHVGSSMSPSGGWRRGGYSGGSQKQDQWVAVVKTNDGTVLNVHCLPDHYNIKKVGDVIHFKEYEGKLLHIQYFAHNDEED